MCRRILVIDETMSDAESVVGDECHIVSAAPNGPRYDSTYLEGRLDDPENLLLLCRVHHKMVDDQAETYDAQLLATLKEKHEKWVATTLDEESGRAHV